MHRAWDGRLNQDLPNIGFPPQNAPPPPVLFQKSIKMEADKDTDVSLKAGGDILEVKPKTQRCIQCTCQDYVFLISNRKILSKPGKDCDGQTNVAGEWSRWRRGARSQP